MTRPVGYGMIDRRGRTIQQALDNTDASNQTVPYGTASRMGRFQAFHARLPSFRPSGTHPTHQHMANLRQPAGGRSTSAGARSPQERSII
jgi:hypothetical protein